jgi:hypothetical protein
MTMRILSALPPPLPLRGRGGERRDPLGIEDGIPWGDLAAVLATRVALPIAWRTPRSLAARLDGFAATEAGSALDMLKAAELTADPRLRRLFFRHALDEARHASLFREAALRVHPGGEHARSEHALVRARRQNLFASMGLVDFVAFVHLSERRAARQFALIARHHRRRGVPEIAELFERVLKDERFHVAYSAHLLERWRRSGRAAEVRWAVLRVRASEAWKAWRRAGRVLGDGLARLGLLALWALVLPLFALAEKRRPPERGWHRGGAGVRTLDDARKEG